MLSVDFADLEAEVYGCLRAIDGTAAGWLSPPGRNVAELRLSGSAPSLEISDPDDLDIVLRPLAGPASFGQARQWLCHATGHAGVVQIDCLARVGEDTQAVTSGPPKRTISALMRTDLAFVCQASGTDPESGTLEARILRSGESVSVDDPRLSTTYDADGTQLRTGLELWESEESEFPLRLAAERVARTQFELGEVSFDCAFLRWHHEGEIGPGVYEAASTSK